MTKTLAGFVMVLAACSSKADGAAEGSSAALTELQQLKDQLCACKTMADCGEQAGDKFSAHLRAIEVKGPQAQALANEAYECKTRLISSAADTERCSSKLRIAMERVLIDKAMAAPKPYKSTEGDPWPKKIYDHCYDDHWPVEVIRCMTAAETRAAFDSCVAAMPAALRDKLGADAKY